MSRMIAGMIFSAEYDQIDDIITKIQQRFDIQVLHVETTYQKLWVTKTPPQEGENAKN